MTTDGSPAAGDPRRVAEFMQLFTHHQRRLYLHALALIPHPSYAEDVLQEASLIMWTRFDQFESGTNFLAWGSEIVRYKALEFFRGRKNHLFQASDQLLDEIAAEMADQSETLADRFDALSECLTKLSAADRQLIQARYQPSADVGQIAQELGRPTRSVYRSIGRIRRQLLACVERLLAVEPRS